LKFLFVGDGLLRETLGRTIREAGLAERFVFTGLVPPGQVPELIGGMDIVVHTSLREGLARVLPQGLLGGKPVVSYDIDGAREVVLPGRTGFLIPPRDLAGLTEAIRTLAADSDLRARYGATGRDLCRERFCHREMTRRLREIYAEVLKERANTAQ
jgi:glycosyltransferase involved in cell wall biosynthesis